MNQFGAFVIVGGIAALVNIGSRILFDYAVSYELAILFGYAAGVTVAFLLSKRFVFTTAKGRIPGQYGRFVIVNVFAFLQVWLVSIFLARFLFPALDFSWQAETVAHVLGVLSPCSDELLSAQALQLQNQFVLRGRACGIFAPDGAP